LGDYRILFGPEHCDEKYKAAISVLKGVGTKIPDKIETVGSCADGAVKVVDLFKSNEKIAAVISSYAVPLLEGCGNVKKGDLRVVGETDPVPFIVAFANTNLSEEALGKIQKTLFEIGKDEKLRKVLETKSGFVPVSEPAKKK
jgi:hypothetical protein